MRKKVPENNRRDFLRKFSLSTFPFFLPTLGMHSMSWIKRDGLYSGSKPEIAVSFLHDGLFLTPRQYTEKLLEIDRKKTIKPDFYGIGGSTKLLEEKFAELTGKENAIYLPTGTMANQLAIKLLNGGNTKVIVPENSHIFRDEADAAQSVHNLRLVPVGKEKSHYELQDLKDTIEHLNDNEVFKSGLGTVVIENPVRRANGVAVPVENIKEIHAFCKKYGYKMHLDAARIHLASAYTNVSVKEYASYFDTAYISLYKYLNASGGAMLCGDSEIIDQIPHQMKIHGGTMFQTWNNTSMALHSLDGLSERLDQVVVSGNKLIEELNKIDGIQISSIKSGTNRFELRSTNDISLKELSRVLAEDYNIWLQNNDDDLLPFALNESLLTRDLQSIVDAWKTAIDQVRF